MHSTDPEAIVFLKSATGRSCAKQFTAKGVVGYDRETWWLPEVCKARNIGMLGKILDAHAERADCVAVVGALTDEQSTCTRIRRTLMGEHATLTHTKRQWLVLDLDGLPVPVTAAKDQLEIAWQTHIPDCLRGVTCWYQFTSSQGMKGPDALHARMFFWLSEAVDTRVLRQWSKVHKMLDPSVYIAHQPIYICRPQFDEGIADPVSGARSGTLQGVDDVVSVRDMDLDACVRIVERVAQVGTTIARLDIVPCLEQIDRAIGVINKQTSSQGRHDHAVGAVCELYGLGAEPQQIVEVVTDLILRQGREPDEGEIERMLKFAAEKSRATGLKSTNLPLDQVLGSAIIDDASQMHKAGETVDEGKPQPLSNGLSDAANAVMYLNQRHPDGTFIRWAEQDWEYNGRCWERLENKEVLKARVDQAGGALLSQSKATNCTAKIRGLSLRERLTLPGWLTTGKKASHAVSLRNGMVFLEDVMLDAPSALLPHNKDYFCTYSLPFAYTPDAKCPTWEKCIDDWFLGDAASKRELQKMFGYLLVPDNRYEKFFILTDSQGRAGKGTAVQVLQWLLGGDAIAATTFQGLGNRFGLASLLTKSVCLLNEANAASRMDVPPQAIDRLKMITGNDPVEIEPKGRDSITQRVPVRFVMSCNRIPHFRDPSGALLKRMRLIEFKQTFTGREDTTLKDEEGPLHKELPGIFLWALEGLRILRYEDRDFFIVQSVKEAFKSVARVAAPMQAFVEDCLEMRSAAEKDSYVVKTDVRACYLKWCEEEGIHPLAKSKMCREVELICPHLLEFRPCGKGRAWTGARFTEQAYELMGLHTLEKEG